jgi:hypothetical protein
MDTYNQQQTADISKNGNVIRLRQPTQHAQKLRRTQPTTIGKLWIRTTNNKQQIAKHEAGGKYNHK